MRSDETTGIEYDIFANFRTFRYYVRGWSNVTSLKDRMFIFPFRHVSTAKSCSGFPVTRFEINRACLRDKFLE